MSIYKFKKLLCLITAVVLTVSFALPINIFAETTDKTVSITVEGSGTVAKNKGIAGETDLGTGASATYPLGTSFTLTAVEDKTSTFVHWKDANSGVILGTDKTYSVTVDNDLEIVAVFKTVVVRLSVMNIGKITGSVTPPQGTTTNKNFGEGASNKYKPGTRLALTAVESSTSDSVSSEPKAKFLYWMDGDTKEIITTNKGFSIVANSDLNLVAVFSSSSIYSLNSATLEAVISAKNSGEIVNNMGMGAANGEENYFSGKTGSFARGTVFKLTAKESVADFLYWITLDKKTEQNKIISFDKTYVTTLVSDMNLTAVFGPRRTTNRKYVTFQNATGLILEEKAYNTGESSADMIVVPKNPTLDGYVFDAWYLNGVRQSIKANDKIPASELTEHRVYTAAFVPAENTAYIINVIDGSGSGTYKANENVVITLDESKVPQGKRFDHWLCDNDILSYDTTFSFSAGAMSDMTIKAIYAPSEQAKAKVPELSISVSNYSSENRTITFMAQRFLPLDYELVETGILVNSDINFTIDTVGVSKVVSTSKSPSGQFCVTKKNPSSASWYGYAKAYLVYRKNNVNRIIYTNEITVKIGD